MGGRGQVGTESAFSACSAWERLQWEEEAEEHQRRLRHGDYMTKKKKKHLRTDTMLAELTPWERTVEHRTPSRRLNLRAT